jgi:hypothetical protein
MTLNDTCPVKMDFLSGNSRFAVQNDGTYLPRITRETCSTKKKFSKIKFFCELKQQKIREPPFAFFYLHPYLALFSKKKLWRGRDYCFSLLLLGLKVSSSIWAKCLCKNYSRRTLAYQELILRIGPLAKLIEAMLTRKISAADSKWPSLPSGPIQSITSWFAKVLHELFQHSSSVYV